MALAALADSKTKTPVVTQLAAKIKGDHDVAATELKALATQKNVALSSSLTAAQKATQARLDKLSGAAFDRAYAAQMITDHRAAVTMFTTATKSADADVKAFAVKTLPILKDHLQRAIDLQKQLVK
jgi:putative membrane protein